MQHEHQKTQARYFAFQFLYRFITDQYRAKLEHILGPERQEREDEISSIFEDFLTSHSIEDSEWPLAQLNDFSKNQSLSMVQGVLNHYEKINQLLENCLKKRNIDKVEKIELTALLLGSFELKFDENANSKIVINDWIELSKKFGTVNSPSFVNGVLDKVAKTVNQQ